MNDKYMMRKRFVRKSNSICQKSNSMCQINHNNAGSHARKSAVPSRKPIERLMVLEERVERIKRWLENQEMADFKQIAGNEELS